MSFYLQELARRATPRYRERKVRFTEAFGSIPTRLTDNELDHHVRAVHQALER